MRVRVLAAGLALLGLAGLGWLVGSGSPVELEGDSAMRHLEVLRRRALSTSPPAVDGPNLVWVIGCTVRKDQVGFHGGPSGLTPALDAFAAGGVVFTDVIAAAPWTKMAATALLTGRHPLSLGMVEPGPQRNDRILPESALTLAEHLHAAGYATLGLTLNPNLHTTFGLDQGFETWIQPRRLWRESLVKVGSEVALPALLAELAEPSPRPRFVLAVLIEAHSPWPEAASDLAPFQEAGLPAEVVAYRAALNRFDRAFEALRLGLAQQGLTEANTLFVLTSDHGEGLGWPANQGRSHGRYLGPAAIEAVWAMTGAGLPRGQRVEGLASQIDVAPTLAALLGRPMTAEGSDLSAAVRSGGPTGVSRVFSDTWFLDVDRAAIVTDDYACQRSFKETRDKVFVEGCFDRSQDRYHERPREVPGMLAELTAWRRRAGVAPPAPRAQLEAETARQLEALGYAAGPSGGEGGSP